MENLSLQELFAIQADIQNELKRRQVIRTKNIKGDVGEYLTVQHFNSSSCLPNLALSKTGNKNIDAVDGNGRNYSIKTITTSSTSCFYGLELPDSNCVDERKFDFLIITELDSAFSIMRMLMLTWEQFLQFKTWHSTMGAWKITLNKKIVAAAHQLI